MSTDLKPGEVVVVLVPLGIEPGEVYAVWQEDGRTAFVLPPQFNHPGDTLVHLGKEPDNQLRLISVTIHGRLLDLSQVRFVTYDACCFASSELFLSQEAKKNPEDHFKSLALLLQASEPYTQSHFILNAASSFLSSLHKRLYNLSFFLTFSTLGLHLINYSRTWLWAVDTIKKDRRLSLWTGNFFAALFVDLVFGYFTLSALTSTWTEDEIFHAVSSSTEYIIEKITSIIDYLMGSPAGLKLNHPLNQCLGHFFQYNIYLWWTFLGLVRPVLEMCYHVFLKIGLFGLTFQIAVIADVFSIVSFHVYCIYVYAARLYELQLNGILSLSRLILGKERNPEPGKVDSCPYTTEQLILGTISFTVLLFLLPTTLVYYIVFTAMRLGVNGVGGIITRTRFILQALPLYSTFMWLLSPQHTARTVRLRVEEGTGSVRLYADLVPDSWWETTRRCIPHTINRPLNVQWKQIFYNMATGKLIYPL